METPIPEDRRYGADEIAALAGIPRRTLRYYIQLGLVERPVGETRAAYYTWQHLNQLLEVRRLSEQGLSLEQILAQRTHPGANPASAALLTSPRPGTVTVRSHLQLAPGVELVIDPAAAGLSPEQLRRYARAALLAFEQVVAAGDNDKEA